MVRLTISLTKKLIFFTINLKELNNSIRVNSSKEEITLKCNKYGGYKIDTNIKCKCMMRDISCVRNLHSNLILVNRLVEKGFTVIFKYNKALIYDKRRLMAVCKLESGLYSFIFKVKIKAVTISIVQIVVLLKVETAWHKFGINVMDI